MTRRIVPLTPDRLAAMPGPCSTCVAWECTPADAGRLDHDAEQRSVEKRAWVSSVLRDWGSCGRVVLDDDRPVGYVVYAPPALVPGADRFPTSPVSPDAVLLTNLWVARSHTGAGLGRQLVQHLARDLVERGGYRAVEAFGTTAPLTRAPGWSSCTPPADFLARVGFATQREHPLHPRMRMDLRSLLRWRDEVEAAVERLRGAVRPAVPVAGPARTYETRPAVRRDASSWVLRDRLRPGSRRAP